MAASRRGEVNVTVLLPVYNGAPFLRPCIDSVLAQTYADFELIVVDDGSADDSVPIVEAYAARDPRVVLHRNPANRGLTATLNIGCELARGRYVAVANHDDVCLPARLERQVAFLDRSPQVAAVGSSVSLIDESGKSLRVRTYPTDRALATWQMHFLSTLVHPATTLRRSVLEEVGRYPSSYGGGTEDFALYQRLCRTGSVCSLPDVLLEYRVHSSNMTKQRWEEQDREASRIVSEGVQRATGSAISLERARQLRGLYTEQYPSEAGEIREIAEIIAALHDAFCRRPDFTRSELRPVHQDAGVRLWMLAILAGRRSVSLSTKLAARAASYGPSAAAAFGKKALASLLRRH